jgi:glycosyltransferase involved in cell wall biosynthesis
MSEPIITVLMPARNVARYIGEAIRSVLAQTFPHFELLIIQDGSTDNTREVIQSFTDVRIRVIDQPPLGIAAALNKGLVEARGEWIARFDADDICLPNRLEKQFEFLHANPGYILTGCDAEYITEDGDHLFNFHCIGHSHSEIMDEIKTYCPFIHSGVMYHKKEVIQAGGYSFDAHHFEDYFLWTKLHKYGYFHNIPEPLIKVRFNPASVTIDEKWRTRRFRRLKRKIIQSGTISPGDGDTLLSEIRKQDNSFLKAGAYETLCGKKFLLDNHLPVKARKHLGKAIRLFPLRLDNYLLYVLSYFPATLINWLHQKSPNKI